MAYEKTTDQAFFNSHSLLRLCQVVMLMETLRDQFNDERKFKMFVRVTLAAVLALLFAGVVVMTWAGYIAPWSGRFYSLWDTGK